MKKTYFTKEEKLEGKRRVMKNVRARRKVLGLCLACGKDRDSTTTLCIVCKSKPYKQGQYKADLRKKHKVEVFARYGGAFCVCCGEDTIAFLSLDHINGDGAKHRRDVKTHNMYAWLRNNDYPVGFQVLCHNCNHGKHINKGTCPHQEFKLASLCAQTT